MKIKILNKKAEKIRFLVEDITSPFANALRRIMITEIPNLVIDYVNITENSSALFDEVLAHRLGMLPLVFDPKKFNFKDQCKCKGKGCPLCEVVFELDKKGPGMVYSSDLKCKNKNVKVTHPNFPIVELLDNHEVKLSAVARLGLGSEHSKYYAANASYQYYPEIEVKGDARSAVKECPKGLLVLRGSKVVLKDPTKCDLCKSCESENLKVNFDDSKFIFNVDSISGLDPAYIIIRAAEILAEKADTFKKAVAKI